MGLLGRAAAAVRGALVLESDMLMCCCETERRDRSPVPAIYRESRKYSD